MKIDKTTVLSEVRRYVIITFALLMMAFGWTGFLIPNHVLGGGVSGISTLIFYATGISTGISVFVINAVLVLISLKILGPSFGVKTVYSIVMASVFFSLLQHFITDPILAGEMAPLVDDKFL
ncbi:MAG: YitT family protein, partial [Bacteroidales bacterium]|nr:YitT family protein [Bacteroidales bacterium]